jgi:hypothetical protein
MDYSSGRPNNNLANIGSNTNVSLSVINGFQIKTAGKENNKKDNTNP